MKYNVYNTVEINKLRKELDDLTIRFNANKVPKKKEEKKNTGG
jgi:hypothetical protein